MEKYTLFADKLTGKLLFNQPLAVYTSLSFYQKTIYQAYLYSFYWIFSIIRISILSIILPIWVILSYIPLIAILSNYIFPRLILIITGYYKSITLLQGNKKFTIKLDKNAIIAGRLTSPFDVLVYALKFSTFTVLVPQYLSETSHGVFNRLSVAFCKILFLDAINFTSHEYKQQNLQKFANKRVIVFPEGTSTNGNGVLKSYLPQEFYLNRQIICAAATRKWKCIPLVHTRFGLMSLIDQTGILNINCSVKCTILPKSSDRLPESIDKGLASAGTVQVTDQTWCDKVSYIKQVDE